MPVFQTSSFWLVPWARNRPPGFRPPGLQTRSAGMAPCRPRGVERKKISQIVRATCTSSVPVAAVGTTVPETGWPSTVSDCSPVRVTSMMYRVPRHVRSICSSPKLAAGAARSSGRRMWAARRADAGRRLRRSYAAVPVSSCSCPRPGVGASGPATIWQYIVRLGAVNLGILSV